MRLHVSYGVAVRVVAGAGIAVIVLVEAVEGALVVRRRAARAVDTWWAAIERRDKRELHRTGIQLLARLAKPR